MPVVSGFYPDTVVGRLRAAGQVEQWFTDGLDPSGYRHHESGHYLAGAKQLVALCGGFTAQKESGVAINFGEIVVPDISGFMTNTVPITFNLGEINSHPSSFFNIMVSDASVGQDFKAFNMRFWMGSLSAFNGMPQPTFYYRNSAQWRQGYILDPLSPFAVVIPSSMPVTGANVFSKSPDSIFVSGNFADSEFSHFIYVRGVFPSGTYTLGTYGGLGQKTFTLRFSYDWTDIDANVNEEDTID